MQREGSLEAPTRHAIDWQNPDFYNETSLFEELERVFDICHGCRRCFNLCQSFPTLFDAVDESDTGELDSVNKSVYWNVVDHCYLCDMCYMTKCPYVPPHPWNLDFPHLMLRAKAVKFKNKKTKLRDKILTSTDTVGTLLGIPVVSQVVNAANNNKTLRKVTEKIVGVSADAILPKFHTKTLRKRDKARTPNESDKKVALFTTCYGNYNEPEINQDLIKVFEHNGIKIILTEKERCCGMPKLELGDLESVKAAKEANIPILEKLVDQGYDIVAPVPSCVLMFKQELPLLFPNDAAVKKVQQAMFDPFEYLMLLHKEGKLNTEFKDELGTIAYQVSCHLRVQNIGMKTRDILQLIPNTKVDAIERCSGHDGTYAVKAETHAASMKIVKPVVNRVKKAEANYYSSDCPMAGHQIENGLGANAAKPTHPMTLLRQAYGI
jgi:glycerol-3-phosphate dehydrogenase subunit C